MNLSKELIKEFMTFFALVDLGSYELRMTFLPRHEYSHELFNLMSPG